MPIYKFQNVVTCWWNDVMLVVWSEHDVNKKWTDDEFITDNVTVHITLNWIVIS